MYQESIVSFTLIFKEIIIRCIAYVVSEENIKYLNVYL